MYSTTTLDISLQKVPVEFRSRIVEFYCELKRRYAVSQFDNSTNDAVGISAGKLCETILRLLQCELTSSFVDFGAQIPNFVDACQTLTRLPATPKNSEAMRVIIPRALVLVYTLRSKRGIGHVTNSIDTNSIDIGAIVKVCDWVVCELIREYHQLSMADAQGIVDGLALGEMPYVWEIAGKIRLLAPELNYRNQTLLLLYATLSNRATVDELFEWLEHSRKSDFINRTLRVLHKERLVEFDDKTNIVHLSPLGIKEVNGTILPALSL